MAAKTPATVGTSGYVDPIDQVYVGPLTTAQGYIANGSIMYKGKYTWRTVYFADIDDGDTWDASGIGASIVAAFWQPDALPDAVSALVDAANLVTFETTSTSNLNGWLHLLIDDPKLQYGKRLL